jgi:hypothetical protein
MNTGQIISFFCFIFEDSKSSPLSLVGGSVCKVAHSRRGREEGRVEGGGWTRDEGGGKIHIHTERERERGPNYVYTYIHIEGGKEGGREGGRA